MAVGSQLGYLRQHEPAGMQSADGGRPATERSQATEPRSRVSDGRTYSRCRWFRAQRLGAHLLRPDRNPVRRLSPGRGGHAAAVLMIIREYIHSLPRNSCPMAQTERPPTWPS